MTSASAQEYIAALQSISASLEASGSSDANIAELRSRAQQATAYLQANPNALDNLPSLVTGASNLSGLLFSLNSILKFKAHKDNPTQVPIGTPIALMFISAALLFLPSILGVTGATMFGGKTE